MNVDVENHAPASPELVPLEVEPPEGPPGKDKIAWLIALDPSTQALVTAACGLAFILLANAQFVGLGVYFVALVPGFVQCKRAFHVYSDSVTKESFTRSALAGFYYTLLVCAAELLALFVLELVTMLTLGRESMTYIVLTSFIEAFCIAGFFEETTKSLITRRAVKFEKAHTASAILAHSIAGAATFATLENVFYLSFRESNNQSVSYTLLFVRTFLCVPLHICWGLSNGAGVGISRLATPAFKSVVPVILPSVILHGLWDLPLFLASKGSWAYAHYCASTNQPITNCFRNEYANSVLAEAVAGFYISIVFFFLIPVISFYSCWRRVRLLRAVETGDLSHFEKRPPTREWSTRDEAPVGTLVDLSFPVEPLPPPPPPPPPLPTSSPSRSDIATWTRAEVGNWLTSVGLEQYVDAFKPVSGAMLSTLSDDDLKELGVAVSVHRRAIQALYSDVVGSPMIHMNTPGEKQGPLAAANLASADQ